MRIEVRVSDAAMKRHISIGGEDAGGLDGDDDGWKSKASSDTRMMRNDRGRMLRRD